ncbi:argininosuccinate lyase [Alsobacter metallidurans]|uniref:Argininosuccinate lyase n=1 Tax=Alsobacter metallidurans TaxID=340221 RepID=A0A917I704_9HYPH|nr:argininosuccinate lyase [Alsobacter metallidurans]GGH16560.1 argininosuccinate lyase [Alsobacter metallidurans]
MTKPTMLWGGRFRSPPSPDLMRLSRADSSFFRLTAYDVEASRAHARELERAGLLTGAECAAITDALGAIARDFHAGALEPAPTDEDVHTFVERALVARLGPLGGKLRAGRSRNDQAANDLKLYLRDGARHLAAALLGLQDALVGQAERHVETVAPGFTHLQPAQPVTFAHQLLAHAQTILRDVDRLRDWDRRHATSPLGAAALAGSAIALRADLSAAELGYDGPCENSIDAVGSRDHVAEFVFVAAMANVHLSRLAEEIFLWSSRQFGWVELHDSYATGSSIMPQKKNADIAELTRGRAARLIGDLSTTLTMLKALPFAYNRDLVEDKRAAFDALDSLLVVLPALAGLVATMTVRTDRLAAQATDGFTLATEVADWLSRRGVPFAEAHEITGALVQFCEHKGVGLQDLSAEDFAAVDPRLEASLADVLTPEAAVAARSGPGGTAPERVREQLDRLRVRLDEQRAWSVAYEGPRYLDPREAP